MRVGMTSSQRTPSVDRDDELASAYGASDYGRGMRGFMDQDRQERGRELTTPEAAAAVLAQTSFAPVFERVPLQGWQPTDIALADRHRGQVLQDRYVDSLLQQQVYSSEAKKYYEQREKRDPTRKT